MGRVEIAGVLAAFAAETIGSKVVDRESFLTQLVDEIQSHDRRKDRVSGQHYIPLPEKFKQWVSAGVGRRTDNPDDYVLRLYRGKVSAYLRRERAVPVESVAVVVYTREAYLFDPDVQGDRREVERIESSDATHVLVAVLASAGPKSPLSPRRLVSNLAGGNREALTWTANEIRAKAAESLKYWDEWEVVAD